MPDDRLARARSTLPDGYQFPTRHEHVHTVAGFDVVRVQDLCRCGARRNCYGDEVGRSPWHVAAADDDDLAAVTLSPSFVQHLKDDPAWKP